MKMGFRLHFTIRRGLSLMEEVGIELDEASN
jgi:hypothetical protein